MEEIWKDVDGFEKIYQVSSAGRVRKLEHTATYVTKNGNLAKRTYPPLIRKLQRSWNGDYLSIMMCHKNPRSIHRMVAIAFIDNPNNLEFVNHIDGNKKNNNVNNLEWCTRQENENHAFRTGLKNSTGSHNSMAKLNEDTVSKILLHQDRSISGKRYLVNEFGVHRATIERIWNRKIWAHVIV